MDNRFLNALAALDILAHQGGVLDYNDDDIEFLRGDRLWLAHDRNRARRGIEAFAFTALDIVGLPRISLPAEFVAAVIALHVHPTNFQVASAIMDGVEWTEDILAGVQSPLKASVIFAMVLKIHSGQKEFIDAKQKKVTNSRAVKTATQSSE